MPVLTILLVDDSQSALVAQQSALTRGGYHVITARSAEEGQRRAVAEQPDLVLVDAEMPRVSGPEACRQLAADPRTASIPVVLVQPGWLPPPPGPAAWRAVVSKPMVEPDFLETVRCCLAAS